MKRFIYILAILVLFSSCKKEHLAGPTATQANYSIDDYTKFTPGNYWVYQVYQVDTNGNVMSVDSQLDSSYVSNDSVINGNTYHVFHERLAHYPFIQCVRDSGGYLVTSVGQRIFTTTYFNTVFDTTGSIPGSVEVRTSVPAQLQDLIAGAGTFQCLDAKTDYYNLQTTISYMQHRVINMDYAQGVGLILGTLFYSTPSYHFEDRLLRYHVQ
ncbi:MAG: hypothetical protein HY064_07685 [Bacteroidetes bacterium]|nr:hypothetical protein [Bacteroidota bacterium]